MKQSLSADSKLVVPSSRRTAIRRCAICLLEHAEGQVLLFKPGGTLDNF